MRKEPDTREGYLYYIRLKTEKGRFYKIGFTKMESVEDRFSYGGSENYKLIDKVLMYKYSMYAYDIEFLLHSHLRKFNTYNRYKFVNLFRDLNEHPLFGDGQTELYKIDVLGLDSDYKKPFISFDSAKGDFVRRRKLSMDGYYHTVKGKAEKRVYEILDSFLIPPLFESKREFIEKRGEWVVSLQRWAIRNALGTSFYTGVSDGKTVHGGEPLPTTESELINLKEFIPVWAYTESIPKEIGHLKNLQVVSFPFDSIKIIPDELYTLNKLKKLDLSYSGIEVISGKIRHLRSLEVLNIEECNNIQKLPIEVEDLPNLKQIIISQDAYDTLKNFLPNKPHLLTWHAFSEVENDWVWYRG